jgi:chemosensory pili system protein ChpA (sensor histidine kinase/response regulator)
MNEAYNEDALPGAHEAIRQYIGAVRELIAVLAISPTPFAGGEQSWTVQTFVAECERLGRLLARAGMSNCAGAVAMLERAGADLPSAESVRDIEAALTFLRGRLNGVVVSDASTLPGSTNDAAGVSVDELAAARDVSAPGADDQDNSEATAAEHAETVVFGGADEHDTFDESKFSAETLAMIRAFQQSTLRRRAPGEVTSTAQLAPADIMDGIPEHLKRACLLEADNDLATLRALVASFGNLTGDPDDLRAMAQIGHKVKGTAGTYEFPVLAEVMYCFEDVPLVLQPVAAKRAADCFNVLNQFTNVIDAAIQEAHDLGDATAERLEEALALVASARAIAPPPDSSAAKHKAVPTESSPLALEGDVHGQSSAHIPAHRILEEDFVRVEPRELDGLMHESDGLALNRSVLAQTNDEISHVQSEIEQVLARLATLSTQLGDLSPTARQSSGSARLDGDALPWPSARVLGRDAVAGNEFDSDVTSSLDESLRSLSEAVVDVTALHGGLTSLIKRMARNSEAQQTVLRGMQQTIIHLRLVSLKPLSDRLALAAHSVAQIEGKQIDITITGKDTEIDRNISDALIDPLTQLVRNAVAHGIESPDERAATGKDPTGKVWLHASYSGNEVSIEVGDDGRGVNPHQLIAAAVAARICWPEHADYLTRDQALDLMFEPGLSTTEKAGVIAGHGIGLDSVRTAIQNLRGKITVRSGQGRGTVFRIRVPISLSITRAMHVRVGADMYAIPLSMIRHMFSLAEPGILVSLPDAEQRTPSARFPRRVRIARSAPEQPLRRPDDPTAALYDEVPVFSLAELLGLEEKPQTSHTALLVDAGQRQVVVLVDEVFDESEVVIRALPEHLRRKAVRGASIMSDGRLFLVLDLADLLTDALDSKPLVRMPPVSLPERSRDRLPSVLVVDDSISMRRALEKTFSGAGYDVRVARDGVEALGMMMAELPDVMVLDVEMPRLDGFELLAVIGANETLAQVPVLILTSRAAEKHHRQALELGARGYLTKPCPDEVLISNVQRVLRERQIQS